MRTLDRWSALRASRPVAAERATIAGLALVVVVVSVWQFGLTLEGVFRGLSLGTWTAVGAWLVLRRRRLAAAREAANRDALRIALARELHDTVAGDVAAIGVQAAAASRIVASRPGDAAEALESIASLARSANVGLRRMLDALRAGELASTASIPGLSALPGLADRTPAGSAADVRVTIDPAATDIDPSLDRAAYRIIEEAVRNARVHAAGAPVDVAVTVRGRELELEIRNGRGSGPDAWPGSGLGLVGMRERAALFGGRVDAEPTPDGGYRVVARLPLDDDARRELLA